MTNNDTFNTSGKSDPCLGQITSDERSKKLQQAKDTVGRMLRYAVASPNIVLSEEILNNVIYSLCKKNEDYSITDEVLLWKVYSELSILINPATDMGIQIADGLKDIITSPDLEDQNAPPVSVISRIWHFFVPKPSRSKLKAKCSKDLNQITMWLILYVCLYVVTQCYIALLSDTLTNSSQLLSQHEKLNATVGLLNSQTPKTQADQITSEFEMLNNQLIASNQALIDLTNPLLFVSLSKSTLIKLGECSNKTDKEALLNCIVLEREYASSIYTILSRYLLPLLLGFIGAIAYITRDTLYRLSANSYTPWIHGKLSMRLCLGGLLGAISGIFISAGAKEAEGFNISLTLVALIMGYSVDVAFSLFDSAIDRLKDWTKGLRESGNTTSPTNVPDKPEPRK
jgi:hypothetical protein